MTRSNQLAQRAGLKADKTSARQTASSELKPLSIPLPEFTIEQFEFFRSIAREHAGIAISAHKRLMVQRRITKRMRTIGFENVEMYRIYLSSRAGEQELTHLVNALTTNKTSFFRERHHYEHFTNVILRRVLANAVAKPGRRFRVWSAGCSTGEEPYTIALLLHDALAKSAANIDAKILATDIDTDVIQFAKTGVYANADVANIPERLRNRHFLPATPNENSHTAAPHLRQLIVFKALNLHGAWPMSMPFDVIFCRNVMIYFDKPSQRKLLDRFAEILAPGGILYVGHSESLYRITDRLQWIGQNVYQKVL